MYEFKEGDRVKVTNKAAVQWRGTTGVLVVNPDSNSGWRIILDPRDPSRSWVTRDWVDVDEIEHIEPEEIVIHVN